MSVRYPSHKTYFRWLNDAADKFWSSLNIGSSYEAESILKNYNGSLVLDRNDNIIYFEFKEPEDLTFFLLKCS